MQAALAMLARRSQPSARIRERIIDRFGSEAAERTLSRLSELRLLDDAAFAERFVRDRFERAGYGRERIRADLLARGIANAEVQAAISAVIDEGGERERAEKALAHFRRARARRTAATARNAARKLNEAAFRHLIGRGFPVALVRELLKRELAADEHA